MDLALALGGGGVRGISHIGVIRCLEEEGFHIRAIAGASAGSIAGALYAAGYTPLEIEDIIARVDQKKIFGRKPSDGPSLMGLAGLTGLLEHERLLSSCPGGVEGCLTPPGLAIFSICS